MLKLLQGQSLVPMLNFRVAQVDNLIDLGEIVELKKIEKFSDYIEIGPMVSQRELLDSPVLKNTSSSSICFVICRARPNPQSRYDRRQFMSSRSICGVTIISDRLRC